MISAKGIKKSYGELHVLKGIDLEISPGEIISIIGKSGAGKSTLLHILGTLDNPDSGSLIINGKDITNQNEKALAGFRNKNIGFVFQFHHLLQEFTALENVCIPGFIAGHSPSDVEARAKVLLNYLGLSDRQNHKPGQLSGGESQRVAGAPSLFHKPTVGFFD
mgnify:FL=1